jgi:hypothetical protein
MFCPSSVRYGVRAQRHYGRLRTLSMRGVLAQRVAGSGMLHPSGTCWNGPDERRAEIAKALNAAGRPDGAGQSMVCDDGGERPGAGEQI